MTQPTYDDAPDAPTRQSPSTFSARMDAFLAWMPGFKTFLDAALTYVDDQVVVAEAAAADAAASVALSNYQGDYDVSTTYAVGESVTYDGSNYYAKTENLGVTPVDGANWLFLVDPVSAGDLADVATSGSYNDLEDKPSIPSAANNATITLSTGIGMASGSGGNFGTNDGSPKTISFAVDKATAANIRAGASNKVITTDGVESACELVTWAGTDQTPDWSTFISADWPVSANRTINNPTAVEPGTTRVVKIRGDSATERAISWGSYYEGNVPDATVTNATFLLCTLYAVSATEIVVSHVEYTT